MAFISDGQISEQEERELTRMRDLYGIDQEKHKACLVQTSVFRPLSHLWFCPTRMLTQLEIGCSVEEFDRMKESYLNHHLGMYKKILQNFLKGSKTVRQQEAFFY